MCLPTNCAAASIWATLEQIPQVAIKVLKDCDSAVDLFFRLANEDNALFLIYAKIAPQVVRIQKQKYPPAGLIPNSRRLFIADGAGKKKTSGRRPSRRQNHPTLILRPNWDVFDEFESQRVDIEANGLVVLAHYNGN